MFGKPMRREVGEAQYFGPELALIVLLSGLLWKKSPGVPFDGDSESCLRILIGRTVMEIRSKEILAKKFSRPKFWPIWGYI